MKKRPAYIEEIIDRTNKVLKKTKVVKPYESDLFTMISCLLHDKGYYEGFNWFVEEERPLHYGGTHKIITYAHNPQDPSNPESVEGAFVQFI